MVDVVLSFLCLASASTIANFSIRIHITNHTVGQQEYFGKSIGPTKRVEISYGPGGVSRGVATIAFARADAAAKAVNKLNGILVDGRAIKVCNPEENYSAAHLLTIYRLMLSSMLAVLQPSQLPRDLANVFN